MSQSSPPSPQAPPLIPSEPQHHSFSFKTLSPSLLIILLILTVTVVASISLCFLLRHLNGRCLRRLAPSSAGSAPAESRRISTRRVSPDNAASLPLFTYSAITRRSSSTVSADCAVCLSKFEPSDELRLLPLCCHAFHAVCIDTWLQSHQTCPLCRSPIAASDAELMALVSNAGAATMNSGSFRLEIGNVSRRNRTTSDESSIPADANRRSYSIGSFEYVVEDESSEVRLSNAQKEDVILVVAEAPEPPSQPVEPSLAAEVGSGRTSWLKDYIDRLSSSLSSRDISFRSSGRFFTGSSRRSEASIIGDWSLESGRVGEEISEMFRWLSGV